VDVTADGGTHMESAVTSELDVTYRKVAVTGDGVPPSASGPGYERNLKLKDW
jgi:hypothetical protein